jgi:hypothetical protein
LTIICFSTGDIEDFPGLDSIPCYKVEVVPGGGVKVRARKSELASNKRLKEMASRDPNNNNTFVIIGGGSLLQHLIIKSLEQLIYLNQLISGMSIVDM